MSDPKDTTNLTIEERIARTLALQAELRSLWECETFYHTRAHSTPSVALYEAVPTEARPHPSKDFCTKEIQVTENGYTCEVVTLFCPNNGVGGHECPARVLAEVAS